eukprot:CAMPEP_0203951734 /NCGR_PEP_ID=MMETSP0359-20131031/85553_1 /ASSEMBLY_ACC=CAM_ASM_000338 /TAXON_ID=268821 /ORGANISM="Scrippsiella Hangoei, Strain SHTV-5" /LENGTH=160 /DNA_ID=CAMNT_0050884453 /DNA_START=227 /DNA_END=709 /DNA_ORIENTATION=+
MRSNAGARLSSAALASDASGSVTSQWKYSIGVPCKCPTRSTMPLQESTHSPIASRSGNSRCLSSRDRRSSSTCNANNSAAGPPPSATAQSNGGWWANATSKAKPANRARVENFVATYPHKASSSKKSSGSCVPFLIRAWIAAHFSVAIFLPPASSKHVPA